MKRLVIAAMCLLTVAAIYVIVERNRNTPKSISLKANLSTDFAFNIKQFITGLSQTKEVNTNIPPLKAMVIPHHLTASSLISQGLKQLSNKNNPSTIVILSPNHTDTGSCPVITALDSWDTPYGIIDVDGTNTSKLLNGLSVCIDKENLTEEHGIASLLPYIKYYFQDTKIIPLSFKRNISDNVLEEIASKISSMEDTVVVASIDFSHGLPPSESKPKDEQTKIMIAENNTEKILGLSSEYLDSPSALVTLLKISTRQKLEQVLLAQKDAQSITNQDNNDNTSYLMYGFHESTSAPKTWSLVATGDVMLGRSVNAQTIKKKDYNWAFKNINSLLSGSDLTIINLEGPLIKDCPVTDSGMIFCGNQEHVQGLVSSGVDIANIANNHIRNYGEKGILETNHLLSSNQISTVGLGNVTVRKVDGITVAFLGFDVTSSRNDKYISKTITDQKKLHPLVIVSFHWGSEYQRNPNSTQKELAHLAIDSGADIIIGHHPHWVQTEEVYKGKPIFYSLGNLIFDQMWSEETKKGMIIKLNFSKEKYLSVEHFPVNIYDYGQPRLATQAQTP